MRREERVESILAAAARAFARTGFKATSMEDIAAEAGITKLIVYRHFEGKKELYEAVLGRVSERLVEAFTAGGGPASRPVTGLRALLTVAREGPDGFLLLFRHSEREPDFASYAEGYVARITTALQVWLSSRIPDPVFLAWTARVLVRAGIEAVIAWLEAGDPGRDPEFLSRTERGLRALVQSVLEGERRAGRE